MASGKKLIKILKTPNVANFNIVPANSIDAANGASLCALGSQICTGNKGVLTANAIKKPQGSAFNLFRYS